LLLQKFQAVSQVASVRATTGTRLAADLLHGMYDTTFLAMHTLKGGNSAKEALDPAFVAALIGM